MTVQELSTEDAFSAVGPSYPHLLSAVTGLVRARGVPNEEAKDLGQEAIVRTLIHLKRHGQRGDDLKPLVFTIARNLLIERARGLAGTVVGLSDEIDVADGSPGPFEQVVENEERTAVAAALMSLGSRHRRVIEMWMRGDNPAEIARTLGIKRNAADALLHRARRRLASILRETGGALGSFIGVLGFRLRRAVFVLSNCDPSALLAQAASFVAAVGIAGALVVGPGVQAERAGVARTSSIARSPTSIATRRTASGEKTAGATSRGTLGTTRVDAQIGTQHAEVSTNVIDPKTGKPGPVGVDIWHKPGSGRGSSEAVLDAGTKTLCTYGCPTIGATR